MMESDDAKSWLCHLAEQVCGIKIKQMNLPMQCNLMQHADALAGAIFKHPITIWNKEVIPQQLLFHILITHEREEHQPVYGWLNFVVQSFLQKNSKEIKKVVQDSVTYYDKHPNIIEKRKDESLWIPSYLLSSMLEDIFYVLLHTCTYVHIFMAW